jgi:spore coat protein H
MRAQDRRNSIGWIVLHALLFSAMISAGTVFPAKSISCADDLFRDGSVSAIEITLSDHDLISLRKHPRRQVSAVVDIDGTVFGNAAVHLKGAGTFQTIEQKPSLTLRFEGLAGLSKVHLNNSDEDRTFAQEQLGSELFAAAGIPSPRVGHARVKVNGEDKGLYVIKEGFTPEFLARNFSEEHAIVYDKTSLGGVAELADAGKESDLERRWQKLNQVLDIDQFVSFLAMEVSLCHWDGYGLANNNFRVFRNSITGRYIFLPAGMDQLFGNPAFPVSPDMTGTLARALFETSEGKERFAMRVAELSEKFDAVRIVQRAREIAFSLRSAAGLSEFAEVREAAEDLSDRIVARGTYLRQQVKAFTAMHR